LEGNLASTKDDNNTFAKRAERKAMFFFLRLLKGLNVTLECDHGPVEFLDAVDRHR
jgi:hypothetical protein